MKRSNKKLFYWCAVITLAFVLWPRYITADTAVNHLYQAHTRVELIPEYTNLEPGTDFRIGILMKMDSGWHSYWKNPGDSGLATKVIWQVPEGVTVGPLEWPAPHRIDVGPLTSYGYSKVVMLFNTFKVDNNFHGKKINLNAQITWLCCKVNCVPGKGSLKLSLPVENHNIINTVFNETAPRFLSMLPVHSQQWVFTAFRGAKAITLKFHTVSVIASTNLKDAEFFPEDESIIKNEYRPKVILRGNDLSLNMQLSDLYDKNKDMRLKGVLVLTMSNGMEEKKEALLVDTAIVKGTGALPVDSSQKRDTAMTMWLSVLFAFLGGIILNLLPCVLPVLSIKVLSLIEHARDSNSKLLRQGLMFTFGVLLMFWILAAVLIILKWLGYHAGWGFQLQQPFVLVFLAVLFFMLSLNLWGIFEIGASLSRFGVKLGGNNSSFEAFNFGMMTTLCATPCTAPFMGVALGYALVQPVHVAFIIFTALGLGLAFPYLVLSRFPRLLRLLPKPGPWMNNLKIIFGFMLIATVLWLDWILGLQKGLDAALALLYFLLLLGFSIWLLRVASARSAICKILCLLFVTVGFIYLLTVLNGGKQSVWRSNVQKNSTATKNKVQWQPYSEESFENAIARGKSVFIDFTAAWCLTCQVNDRLVFNNPQVINALNRPGIVAFKADWTDYNEQIAKALKRYGRTSIPLYVLHKNTGSGGDIKLIIFPELITPGIILEKIKGINT